MVVYLALLACQPQDVVNSSQSPTAAVLATSAAPTQTAAPTSAAPTTAAPSPTAAPTTAAPTETPAPTPQATPPPTPRPTPPPTPVPTTPPPTPSPTPSPSPTPTPPPTPTPTVNPNGLSIRGVVSSGGQPVAGACIAVGPPVRCATTTDASGNYFLSLDSAPPGLSWDVRALVGGVIKAERLGVIVSGPTVVNFAF